MLLHRVWCYLPRPCHLRPYLRHTVLAWILLSQFPMPLIHAHTAGETNQSRLTAHLREDHADQPTGLGHHGLHWHLISPWDGTDGDDQRESETSPLGLWGAKGPAIVPVQASIVDSLKDALQPRVRWDRLLVAAVPTVSASAVDAYPSGFVQTYAGVSACALLGIALR